MNAPRSTNSEIVRHIRQRLERASTDWMFEGDPVRLTALDHGTTDPQPVCTFNTGHNPADIEFLVCAYGDITTLLGLLAKASDLIKGQAAQSTRPTSQQSRKPKDYAAAAAIATGYAEFRRYLEEFYGLSMPRPTGDADADNRARQQAADDCLRKALNIASRRELNSDKSAALRWRKLNTDYFNWKNGQ